MAKPAKTSVQRIDNFLAMQSGRSDLWRDALTAAQHWASGHGSRAAVEASMADLAIIEEFHAYPGVRLMAQLREKIAAGDAAVAADMVRRFSDAILTGAYSYQAERGEAGDEGDVLQDVLPTVISGRDARRPYFEVLMVSPQPASRWPVITAEMRRLRRVEDSFVYEPVIVGSFEDALCAAIVNPKILAVIVAEGVPFRSKHEAPVLRRILDDTIGQLPSDASALKLAGILKGLRPDLDIYVTTDREVEKLASDPAAACARRIFYAVEEFLELHLAVLEGIQARFETPFFDNLKRYAQRPIGTFHALPIARGKSVFSSPWIRDMGEFYGINLFLAESSATTGGLDSLLEPTGNIKKAQEMAARAFGADHVFFVTNGTSTSNKMVVQALVAPGDIVIVDRNCHKSHHYGLVLGGGQPLYVEAFPLTQYSMYGAVPLAGDQEGAARPARRGPPRPRAHARSNELHLRRPHVQHEARHGGMPRDQAGPDLPVGRGMVRLCAVVAVPAPAHRHGCRCRDRGVAARSGIRRRVREAAEGTRLQAFARKADGDTAHPRSAKGSAARLPDQFHAQVDVCNPAGIDGAGQGRRLRIGRKPVPRSGLHARVDQPQPAADRQS